MVVATLLCIAINVPQMEQRRAKDKPMNVCLTQSRTGEAKGFISLAVAMEYTLIFARAMTGQNVEQSTRPTHKGERAMRRSTRGVVERESGNQSCIYVSV